MRAGQRGTPGAVSERTRTGAAGSVTAGVSTASTYEEKPFSLEVGDHVSLYTDGLLEARNNAGEIYSFGRLQTLFATRPDATRATEAAVTFGQDDDITVLTLTRLATGEDSTVSHSAPSLASA